LEKHRHGQPDIPRRVVFDDFIHVVDTVLFLAPRDVLRRTIETHVVGGLLHAVTLTLTLAGDGFSAVGTIHRNSGLNEERLDVIGDGARYTVLNLADRIEAGGAQRHYRRGDWVPVGRQRGFEAMCEQFLHAARERTVIDSKAI